MPQGPIIDAHVHLWDPEQFRIPWIDGSENLGKAYGLPDYDAATAGVDVDGIVYLEVDVSHPYAILEAEALVALAGQDPRIQGIVPWAPLEDGTRARSFLAALTEMGPLVKGVRRIYQAEPDPAFCLRPDFVRGVQLLPDFGLSFDLCCTYVQLANTVELVRRCPETSFILDHIAKPSIRTGGLDPWRSQMSELAEFPNVVCKISGVLTEASPDALGVEDVRPYVEHALAAFGEDRVVFGGDWPVVTEAAPWRTWVDTLDAIVTDWPETAKRKLWADNARAFYRLPAA